MSSYDPHDVDAQLAAMLDRADRQMVDAESKLLHAEVEVRAARASIANVRAALTAPRPKAPARKFALIRRYEGSLPPRCGRTTDQEYAAASGEPIPEWMQVKHDVERK